MSAGVEFREAMADELARGVPLFDLCNFARATVRSPDARDQFLALARVAGRALTESPATPDYFETYRRSDWFDPGVIELMEGSITLHKTGDPTAVERAAVTYTTWFDGGKI
jgi:hypothetical protein